MNSSDSSKKNIILIGIAVVLLAGAAYMLFFRSSEPKVQTDAETEQALKKIQEEAAKDPNAGVAPVDAAAPPPKSGLKAHK